MLKGLFLHCTFQPILVPLQIKEFFLLLLHQDYLFLQILNSYNKYFIFTNGVRISLILMHVSWLGLSLHPRFLTKIISYYLHCYTYVPVGHVVPRKFELPFRLELSSCEALLSSISFSEAIQSQVSTPSYMFWALSGVMLLTFCSPQSCFWASLARVSVGVQ